MNDLMLETRCYTQNPIAPPGAMPCYTVDAPQEFDEEGKELGPDAQVWKTYVKEADQVDEELVDGWNKSMDVILIFAALFSAISTAFVIESYKNLKQDPADVSSETLIVISKTLAFIANGSQLNSVPPTPEPEAEFRASSKAICVNVLWFLSLSLSVAVSLISMLAKEWCLEFMAGRIGPPGAQARRRQQRWDGLVWWKMKEVIVILPSLIHLSLLLFAIGLCVFLWDVHFGVAIPVVVVTTMAVSAYFACTILPFVYDYCPYGTVLSRLYKQFTMTGSQKIQDGDKQDEVTANALQWMIVNCETPRSVDVALQSLAGAEETLPPKPLEECGAWTVIKQRVLNADPRSLHRPSHAMTSLYERALRSYVIMRRGPDRLKYGTSPETARLEQVALSVQFFINSEIHRVKMTAASNSLDRNTKRVLDKCALIGPNYLYRAIYAPNPNYLYDRPTFLINLNILAKNLMECLERLQGDRLDPALFNSFVISLAFTMCCIMSDNPLPESDKVNIRRVLRLFELPQWGSQTRGILAPPGKAIVINAVLVTLWILIPSNCSSNTCTSARTPHASTEIALDILWAFASSSVDGNESVMKRADMTHVTYGLMQLLINSYHLELNDYQTSSIASCLQAIMGYYDRSVKIQSNHHAQHIEDISRIVALEANCKNHNIYYLVHVLQMLFERSPSEQTCLFPTPEVYTFLIRMTFDVHRADLYEVLNSCPLPKHSPRLAQLLSTGVIVPSILKHIDSHDIFRRAFATTQLWLLFDMSLRATECTSQAPSPLTAALLRYPPLENNLDNQARVMEELEVGLLALLARVERNSLYTAWWTYMCRVVELVLQRGSTPLPESFSMSLRDVPPCLRGITSLVNLETDRSTAYPDVEFDSEGWIVEAREE